jgi:DNA/RNA endonuclease YhcR with UshA esterase domain/methionine-rich copper-binding protein CopC
MFVIWGYGFFLAPNHDTPRILAAPTELFFSEYIEGSGFNKALEIFNGTGVTIDLGTYSVELYSNGSPTPSQTVILSGNLNDGDVFVLARNNADPIILGVTDLIANSVVNFNGNDSVVLKNNGVIIDVIGQIGVDPGTQWISGSTSTLDNTLRRKSSIESGDTNGSDPFDPAIEWDGFAQNTFDGLGSHAISPPPPSDLPPTVTSTTPTDGATNVAINTNININFSENVTVTNPWFTINCSISGPHTAMVSASLQNYTLTPNITFANGENCAVTILQGGVADQDGIPPDNMVANYSFSFTTTAGPLSIVINEVAWGGTAASAADEWIELLNTTTQTIALDGWVISNTNNSLNIPLDGTTIGPNSYYLIERTDDNAVSDITADLIDAFGGVVNGGDTLYLVGAGVIVDTVNGNGGGWPGGSGSPDYTSMERNDPALPDSDANWRSNNGVIRNGLDANGNPLNGTPKQPNSVTFPAVVATTPISGATGVPVTTTLTLQFNEVVAITGSAFSLNCGSPIGLNITPPPPGNAAAFTLTPAAALPDGSTCAVTVSAPQITDLDDAPDNMAANYAFTFATAVPPAPAALILIGEFVYDGLTPSTEGDEFVELCNPNPGPVDLTGYKVGDEETAGGGESMYYLPAGTLLAPGACLTLAKSAADFQARFGALPDLEINALSKYTAWGSGSWSLANTGDELLVLGPGDEILDSVAYRNGDYATLGLEPDATAPEPASLQRVWPVDTNSMPYDFVKADPTPGVPTIPPPSVTTPPAALPDGMFAYWGHLHAHTTYSDGSGPPHYALALARAAGLHYYGITDHGWWLTESEWANTLTQTTNATVPGQFVALRGVEWSHATSGHINVFNSDTLLQRTNPLYDTLPEFYDWLAANPNAIAQFNHPDPNFDGTFDDFVYYPLAAPMVYMQEVGNAAQSYTTYEAPFVQANSIGWRVAPAINSDTHDARWGSDLIPRTGIVAPSLTEADLLAAMRARRVFATEDSNLALTLRANGQWMGSVLTAAGILSLTIDVVDPDPEAITLQLYDSNLLLATAPLPTSTGQWNTIVNALPGHFFWVKAVQADGDVAYTAPIWLEGVAPVDALVINEIMPAPFGVDWDGNGQANGDDEWIELYNPLDRPVGLGGWRLRDSAGVTYNIPLEVSIPAGGYVVLYKAQTGIALNNNGDTLSLTHPNGAIINIMSYDHSPGSNDSWCRVPDGGPTWSDNCLPFPAAPNHSRPFDSPDSEPLRVKIFDAKRLTLGAWVVVTGRVTAPPGVLGSRTMYIQDSTAGIKIYLPRDHRLHFNVGDVVEVEGNLDSFHEEFEIEVDERGDVNGEGSGPPLPPLPIATTSLLEPYEGLLVMLQGQAVHFKGRTTLWLDDGTGWAKVFISSSSGIRKPFIEPGAPLTVVGVVSQYSDPAHPSREDYSLLPRFQTDLIVPPVVPPAPVPANWPIFLPETGNQ